MLVELVSAHGRSAIIAAHGGGAKATCGGDLAEGGAASEGQPGKKSRTGDIFT